MKALIRGTSLTLLLLALFGTQSFAQNTVSGSVKSSDLENCGRIHGKSTLFMFCAPKGWNLDENAGHEDGILVAFYPDGSSWDSAKQSETVLYIKTHEKENEGISIKQFMAFDSDEVKKNAQSSVVKKGKTIQVGYLDVPVRLFSPGISNRFEAVAYVDSPEFITMFVMNSNNPENIKRDYPAFVKLVKSYYLLAGGVAVRH
jgi:hypothetical protein